MRRNLIIVPLMLLALLPMAYPLEDVTCEFVFMISRNGSAGLIRMMAYPGIREDLSIAGSSFRFDFIAKDGSIQTISPPIFFSTSIGRNLDQVPFAVRADCSREIQYLAIYHNGSLRSRIDVGSLLCSIDGICNNDESILTCPEDCPTGSADRYCDAADDGICDMDCYLGDADCVMKRLVSPSESQVGDQVQSQDRIGRAGRMAVLAVLILAILIGLIYLSRRRGRRQSE